MKVFLLICQSNVNGRGNITTLEDKLFEDAPRGVPPEVTGPAERRRRE